MVLLEKLWDDIAGGPNPDRGLDKLRKLNTQNLPNQGSATSAPVTPTTPTTPVTPSTPNLARKENVWRSVFHPGSNTNTKTIGAHIFDKPTATSSRTTYDWLYSGDSRSKYM